MHPCAPPARAACPPPVRSRNRRPRASRSRTWLTARARFGRYDRLFFDPTIGPAGNYTVKRWLDDVNERYGGVDSILMWRDSASVPPALPFPPLRLPSPSTPRALRLSPLADGA